MMSAARSGVSGAELLARWRGRRRFAVGRSCRLRLCRRGGGVCSCRWRRRRRRRASRRCDQPQALQASSMWRTPSAPHFGPWGLSIQSEWVSGAESGSLVLSDWVAKTQAVGTSGGAGSCGERLDESAAGGGHRVELDFGVGGEVDFLLQKSWILERVDPRGVVNCRVNAIRKFHNSFNIGIQWWDCCTSVRSGLDWRWHGALRGSSGVWLRHSALVRPLIVQRCSTV